MDFRFDHLQGGLWRTRLVHTQEEFQIRWKCRVEWWGMLNCLCPDVWGTVFSPTRVYLVVLQHAKSKVLVQVRDTLCLHFVKDRRFEIVWLYCEGLLHLSQHWSPNGRTANCSRIQHLPQGLKVVVVVSTVQRKVKAFSVLATQWCIILVEKVDVSKREQQDVVLR